MRKSPTNSLGLLEDWMPAILQTEMSCQVFSGVGRSPKQLRDVDAGRAIYAAAVRTAPTQAHTLQQWAIFELHHRHGSLQRAEELVDRI
jgi:hypothetical protein